MEFIDTHERQDCIYRLVKCEKPGCKLEYPVQHHLLLFHQKECGKENYEEEKKEEVSAAQIQEENKLEEQKGETAQCNECG